MRRYSFQRLLLDTATTWALYSVFHELGGCTAFMKPETARREECTSSPSAKNRQKLISRGRQRNGSMYWPSRMSSQTCSLAMWISKHSFHLHRTFEHTWRRDHFRWHWRESGDSEFVGFMPISPFLLSLWHGISARRHRQSINSRCLCLRRQVARRSGASFPEGTHALAGADEIFTGLSQDD